MQDVELLERLLEAHRELGSLRAKLAEAQAEAQRARLESLNPAHIRKLMEEAIEETHWIIPLTKLYRAITGMGLQDSKKAIDHSRLGKLIRSNMREYNQE